MAKQNTEETILDVQEVYTKTELFIEKNKKTLLGILIAVVLVILAYFVYNSLIKEPANREANERVHMAEMYFMMDSTEVATVGNADFEGFQTIIDEEGGAVAMRANYQMGIINRDNGDYEGAIENFKAAQFGSPLLGAMVNGNIGDCLVEIGASLGEGSEAESDAKYKEALPYFKKAANSSPDEVTTQFYYRKAANVCLKVGMYSEAENMCQSIMDASTNVNSADYKEALKLKAYAAALAAQK